MGYTNSNLVDCVVKSPNHSGRRTHSIDRLTPHCVVGQLTAESIGHCFPSGRGASCNYGIGKDGRVCLVVDEANRSWCSSSNANDQRAVTIECASDMQDPYTMTSAVYEKLVKLCTDICRRNGKRKLLWFGNKNKTLNYAPAADEMVLTVHRWFANKSCPGDWLYNRLGDLANRVTAALGGAAANPAQPAAKTLYRVRKSWGDAKSQLGAYGVLENAKKACAPGYSVYDEKGNPVYGEEYKPAAKTLYRVRKSWGDAKSQLGAYGVLENAKKACTPGYTVYDEKGNPVYGAQLQNKEPGNDRVIWDFLKSKGLNDHAVAGIMANLYAESALNPRNLQNTYEKKLGVTDEKYTENVDNGSYDNFVKDGAGYGLAQWTYYSRKQELLDEAKVTGKSIGDLSMQLAFFWKELQRYKSVVNVLIGATTVREASDAMLTGYERPADQGEAVQEKREKFGLDFYNKFAGREPETQNKEPDTPYKVRVEIDNLRIRTGAGTEYAATGHYTGSGVFTITEVKAGKGSRAGWGKLKSGAGWISLDYCTRLAE